MTNYTDIDLTFFIGLYRDQLRARSVLAALREKFPESTLIIRSDGDSNSSNSELAKDFNAHYYQEQRLYPIANRWGDGTQDPGIVSKSPIQGSV